MASGRPHLYPDHEFHLFLAGWGLIPGWMATELDTPEMLETLRARPDAIVIHYPDVTLSHLQSTMPRLFDFIRTRYSVVARYGDFRVLKREPGPAPGEG